MNTLTKLLFWIPLIGIFAEAYLIKVKKKDYLTDPFKPWRLIGAAAWHGLSLLGLIFLLISIKNMLND